MEAATALVVKHGFAHVTVDDICRDADISRRTFFNYMDSKDEAVLGTMPARLGDAAVETLISTATDDLVDALLAHLAVAVAEATDLGDRELQQRLHERRREILAAEPTVELISHARFRDLGAHLREVVVKHLDAHPHRRRLPQEPVEKEAAVVVGLVREVVLITSMNDQPNTGDAEELLTLWRANAEKITTVAKGQKR